MNAVAAGTVWFVSILVGAMLLASLIDDVAGIGVAPGIQTVKVHGGFEVQCIVGRSILSRSISCDWQHARKP